MAEPSVPKQFLKKYKRVWEQLEERKSRGGRAPRSAPLLLELNGLLEASQGIPSSASVVQHRTFIALFKDFLSDPALSAPESGDGMPSGASAVAAVVCVCRHRPCSSGRMCVCV